MQYVIFAIAPIAAIWVVMIYVSKRSGDKQLRRHGSDLTMKDLLSPSDARQAEMRQLEVDAQRDPLEVMNNWGSEHGLEFVNPAEPKLVTDFMKSGDDNETGFGLIGPLINDPQALIFRHTIFVVERRPNALGVRVLTKTPTEYTLCQIDLGDALRTGLPSFTLENRSLVMGRCYSHEVTVESSVFDDRFRMTVAEPSDQLILQDIFDPVFVDAFVESRMVAQIEASTGILTSRVFSAWKSGEYFANEAVLSAFETNMKPLVSRLMSWSETALAR